MRFGIDGSHDDGLGQIRFRSIEICPDPCRPNRCQQEDIDTTQFRISRLAGIGSTSPSLRTTCLLVMLLTAPAKLTS